MSFKSTHPFEKRLAESSRIFEKYPNRIPVVCERGTGSRSDIPDIDKKKYLVPTDLTMGQFMYVIRKRLSLSADKALFLFVNNSIPTVSESMANVYMQFKDADGFLYVTYSGENVFGASKS